MTLSRYVVSVTRSSRVLRVSLTLVGMVTVSVAILGFAQPVEAHGACHPTHSHHCPTHHQKSGAKRSIRRSTSSSGSSGNSGSSGISAWTPVPGHPSYTMHDFAGDPNARYFGVCTWWAWYNKQSEGLLGNGKDWTRNAQARGYATGTVPVVGATVVFQPGVEGASRMGHVGHVEQVLSGGWFVISEMNFYWNGGGWGKVDYRYVQVEPGVSFVY